MGNPRKSVPKRRQRRRLNKRGGARPEPKREGSPVEPVSSDREQGRPQGGSIAKEGREPGSTRAASADAVERRRESQRTRRPRRVLARRDPTALVQPGTAADERTGPPQGALVDGAATRLDEETVHAIAREVVRLESAHHRGGLGLWKLLAWLGLAVMSLVVLTGAVWVWLQ